MTLKSHVILPWYIVMLYRRGISSCYIAVALLVIWLGDLIDLFIIVCDLFIKGRIVHQIKNIPLIKCSFLPALNSILLDLWMLTQYTQCLLNPFLVYHGTKYNVLFLLKCFRDGFLTSIYTMKMTINPLKLYIG